MKNSDPSSRGASGRAFLKLRPSLEKMFLPEPSASSQGEKRMMVITPQMALGIPTGGAGEGGEGGMF